MIVEIREGDPITAIEISPENEEEWKAMENNLKLIVNGVEAEQFAVLNSKKLTIFYGDTEPFEKMMHGFKIYIHKEEKKK